MVRWNLAWQITLIKTWGFFLSWKQIPVYNENKWNDKYSMPYQRAKRHHGPGIAARNSGTE